MERIKIPPSPTAYVYRGRDWEGENVEISNFHGHKLEEVETYNEYIRSGENLLNDLQSTYFSPIVTYILQNTNNN